MTLLLAARAMDGLVAISDRKESVPESQGNEVSKCHLDSTGGFYLALSGDGTASTYLLGELRQGRISSDVIFKEIEKLAASMHSRYVEYDPVVGHLVVAKGNGIRLYTVRIEYGNAVFAPNNEAMLAEGDYGAIALFKNLAQNMALASMPCEAVARYLHTLVSRIAETVESVGRRDMYGIDVAVFAKAGGARMLERCTGAMGTIDVVYKASGAGPLFGRNGGV